MGNYIEMWYCLSGNLSFSNAIALTRGSTEKQRNDFRPTDTSQTNINCRAQASSPLGCLTQLKVGDQASRDASWRQQWESAVSEFLFLFFFHLVWHVLRGVPRHWKTAAQPLPTRLLPYNFTPSWTLSSKFFSTINWSHAGIERTTRFGLSQHHTKCLGCLDWLTTAFARLPEDLCPWDALLATARNDRAGCDQCRTCIVATRRYEYETQHIYDTVSV